MENFYAYSIFEKTGPVFTGIFSSCIDMSNADWMVAILKISPLAGANNNIDENNNIVDRGFKMQNLAYITLPDIAEKMQIIKNRRDVGIIQSFNRNNLNDTDFSQNPRYVPVISRLSKLPEKPTIAFHDYKTMSIVQPDFKEFAADFHFIKI